MFRVRRGMAATLAWLCVMAGLPAHAQVGEPELKAAYVFNFIQFIDWPARDMPAGEDITVCVSSFSPLRRALQALDGKPVPGGRQVRVRLLEAGDLKACRVLVMDRADPEPIGRAFRTLPESHGVLSITEDAAPGAQEAVIVLSRQDGRIVFGINAEAATRAGLSISSKLMRLARGVR